MNQEYCLNLQSECPCNACAKQSPDRGCPVGVESCEAYGDWFVPVWEATCSLLASIAEVDLHRLRSERAATICVEDYE